jgi:hypothetical protein
VLDFCRYSDGNPAQWTDLLGRGPGLTPAGDDVLAGLLAGRAAYGPDDRALADAICALAPSRTTALSAALLRHAARGECIPEVAAFTAALTGAGPVGPAAARLLAVGHTSDGARAAATGPGPLDRDGALPAGLATAGAR